MQSNIEEIKRIVIIALASDDELVKSLVLKGGSAISLYQEQFRDKTSRTSYDLDFSLDEHSDVAELEDRIEKTLETTFTEYQYKMLDYKFIQKPGTPKPATADFWGGYKITFKLVPTSLFEKKGKNVNSSIRSAIALRPNNSNNFEIEISRYEYTGGKMATEVDGFKIYIYSPEMIAFEKIRALCQQLPEYGEVVPGFHSRARARDYYDLHLIMESCDINPSSTENIEILKIIFEAKRVPIDFISKLRAHSQFHRDNWKSVEDTVKSSDKLQDFDFYVDYVLSRFEAL